MKYVKEFRILTGIYLIVLLISCRFDRVYNNRTFRYTIKYPEGWIAINSGHDKERENNFKNKLIEENVFNNFVDIDVAFYNPDSKPPIYEHITVKSHEARFNLNNLEQNRLSLERLFSNQLSYKFNNVRLISSQMKDFKKGRIVEFEFLFEYNRESYYAGYIILPGKLFATYYFSYICREQNRKNFKEKVNKVLSSFNKY